MSLFFLGCTALAHAQRDSFDGISDRVLKGDNVTANGWAIDVTVVSGGGADGPDPVTVGPADQVKMNISGVSDTIISTGGYRPDVQAANMAANPHWSTTDVTYSGWNFTYNTASLAPGTYTMTAYSSVRQYFNPDGESGPNYYLGFVAIGSKTFTVVWPSSPTGSISADQTTLAVGSSTTIHASFSADTGNLDYIANTNIDSPLGSPVTGSDSSAQASRSYSFHPGAVGAYTFYGRMATHCYGWNTYGTVTVNVGTAPSVSSNSDVSVTAGQNAVFTPTIVQGSGPNASTSYQWQVSTDNVNWSNLSSTGFYRNTNTSQLTVQSVPISLGGYHYRLQVGNPYGSMTSSSATLHVGIIPPQFTTQPSNLQASVGTQPAITATASGTPAPSITWEYLPKGGSQWIAITNNSVYTVTTVAQTGTSTTSRLSIVVSAGLDQYQFHAIANNGNAVTSSSATLTIVAAPPNEGDIPAMPPWALGTLALTLFAAGRRFLFGKKRDTV